MQNQNNTQKNMFTLLQQIQCCTKKILVFGDTIYDKYILGHTPRLSPEAPVPVFVPDTSEWRLGGAGNVLNNIIKTGGNASICTLLGNDEAGKQMKDKLSVLSQDTDLIFFDTQRRTTQKTRFLMQNGQQLLRMDEEDTASINEALSLSVLEKIRDKIDAFDILVITDYAKGFVTDTVVEQIIHSFNRQGKMVLTDPKSDHIEKYNGSFLIKPNLTEFLNFFGGDKTNTQLPYLIQNSEILLEKSNVEYLYITLGPNGGLLIGRSIAPKLIPVHGGKAIDITGAGDTVISAIALALSAGIDIAESTEFASYAAGVCVQKIGAAYFTLHEIKQLLSAERGDSFEKLY